MDSQLPQTGTAEFLELISPHVPDEFINDLLPPHRGQGRRCQFNAGQLWRMHLLSVLTPVHAFNLLVQMLAEQKAWRHFAHLPNRHAVPDVWMLHQFRQRAGVSGLRRVNEHLLQPLLPLRGSARMSVALIDATDLEAACSGHKKSELENGRPRERRSEPARSRRARANSSSATRSTPSVFGSHNTRWGSYWFRWSVGSLRPTGQKAFFCAPASGTVRADGSGTQTWSWQTWVTSMPPANGKFGSAGRWLSSRA